MSANDHIETMMNDTKTQEPEQVVAQMESTEASTGQSPIQQIQKRNKLAHAHFEANAHPALKRMRDRRQAFEVMTPEQQAQERNKEQQRKQERERLFQERFVYDEESQGYRRKTRYDPNSVSEKVFRPLVQGLTDITDFAMENIADKVGVPSVVTQAYKRFAPPTSKFYKR